MWLENSVPEAFKCSKSTCRQIQDGRHRLNISWLKGHKSAVDGQILLKFGTGVSCGPHNHAKNEWWDGLGHFVRMTIIIWFPVAPHYLQ